MVFYKCKGKILIYEIGLTYLRKAKKITKKKLENNSLINMSLKLLLIFVGKNCKFIFLLLLWLLTKSNTENKKINKQKTLGKVKMICICFQKIH